MFVPLNEIKRYYSRPPDQLEILRLRQPKRPRPRLIWARDIFRRSHTYRVKQALTGVIKITSTS